MTDASWLKRYYGKDYEALNPSVVFDGPAKAVVCLRPKLKGITKVGYVLVQKPGKHNLSSEQALYEGPASTEIMTTWKKLVET